MVVDDNLRSLRALTALLRRYGVEAVAYGSFQHAIAAIESQACPTALIADYVLDQGRTGLELLQRARERFGDRIYIALCTAYESPGFGGGLDDCDAFVPKPISRDDLVALLLHADFRRFGLAVCVRDAVLELAAKFTLSVQETRVLSCLAKGSTRARLAVDLGLSTNTLKSQVRSLLNKTCAADVAELSSLVLRSINSHRPLHSRSA